MNTNIEEHIGRMEALIPYGLALIHDLQAAVETLKAQMSAEQGIAQLPVHLTITEVVNYLQTSESTFYRQVRGKLMYPVTHVGRRPYYLLGDLQELMKHTTHHQRGAGTFAKLNKLRSQASA